jgi:hypothetical protein
MGLLDNLHERRLERQQSRQDSRSERTRLRQEAKAMAYESGVNPNEGWQNLISKGLDVGAQYLTGSKNTGSRGAVSANEAVPTAPAMQSNYLIYIGVAVVALFMLKKK